MQDALLVPPTRSLSVVEVPTYLYKQVPFDRLREQFLVLVNQRDTAPAYAAMEPRQYRASGMSVSEGRNGGGAKAYPVELAKQQNGRANKISSRDSRDINLFLPCVLG